VEKDKEKLMEKFSRLNDELFENGITRTDSYTGEIGEYVISKYFNLKLSEKSTEGYDGICKKGERYQIKAKIEKGENVKYSLQDLKINKFEFLIIIVFNEKYEPRKIFKIKNLNLKKNFSFSNKFLKENPNLIEEIKIDKNKISKKNKELLEKFGDCFSELEKAGIIRTRHIVGDIGEYYACDELGLERSEKNKKGFDAKKNGETYEIKTRRVYESERRKSNTRRINGLQKKTAKYLIVVELKKNFQPREICKMLLENIENKGSLTMANFKKNGDYEIIFPNN
jgi:hypothetical protein